MPRAKHRRKGRLRPRGKPPRMPPWPQGLPEEGEGDHTKPAAEDLLDWHPHIQREPDPRQGELRLAPEPYETQVGKGYGWGNRNT